MSESNVHRERIEQLAFECLDRMSREGASALEEVCAAHPECATAIRGAVGHLRAAGLVEYEQDEDVGRPFGEFRLLRRLGSGGMGVVWLADQPGMKRQVAIKLMRAGTHGSARARERFRREALAVSNLNHPGICTVFEVGELDKTPYIAMRYVPGETLAQRLAHASTAGQTTAAHRSSSSGPSTHAEIHATLELVEKLARTIHAAHEFGIVHRDIKPSNVMIGPDDEPVVLDFGLAKAMALAEHATLTMSGDVLGTPAYMSPEQVRRGNREIDRHTDIYSLGATLYEALTLERPFAASTYAELYERIVRDPTPDPRRINHHLPPDLSAVLAKAMEKDPAKRYATAAEFADELARIRKHEPVRARRIGPLGRTWRWMQRNPTAAALVVSLVVGLLVTTSQWIRADANESKLLKRSLEFKQLSNIVRLRRAQATLGDTYPAWPKNEPAIAGWLREHADPLLEALPELVAALEQLEARALPRTEEDVRRDRETHPRYSEFRGGQNVLATERQALAVRNEGAGPPAVELDERTRKLDAAALNAFAWERVSPSLQEQKIWGEEYLGLAAARLAVEKAEKEMPDALPQIYDTLACALMRCGLDDDARRAMARALELAPISKKRDFAERSMQLESWIAERTGEAGADRLAYLEAQLADTAAAVAERRTWRFDLEEEEFLRDALANAVAGIESFEREITAARKRHAWAARLTELTLAHPRAKVSWDDACAAVAAADGTHAHELYEDGVPFPLVPQAGLVPIGMNPVTKLWEFYHLRSAWDPNTDVDAAFDLEIPEHGEDGSIAVGEGTGIVFVLIPGGYDWIGAQSHDPDGANYDPYAERGIEALPRRVGVAPFFIARHELTQAQYVRLTGEENPTNYFRLGLTHAVTFVDWPMAVRAMEPHGLLLPSQDWLEYASRAGTDTPWWTGDTKESLFEDGVAANTADRALLMQRTSWQTEYWSEVDDGYPFHAPVDQLLCNPWGLHHVHGNVAEWTYDRVGTEHAVIRGGAFSYYVLRTRCASRQHAPLSYKQHDVGMRASRRVWPEPFFQ